MKRLILCLWAACLCMHVAIAQCSSGINTPEFPIATHPSDQHTQSWGANIFTPTQFGSAATITGVQIYVDNSFGPTTYTNQTIWMRHTAVSSYPNANYPTTAGFTQVYSGTYNFPMSGLVTLPFNISSFAYNGTSNVEILFENRSNVYRVNEPWFRRTASYGAGVYRSKWNGNFGFGGFPGSGSDGSAVRLTYTLSLTRAGGGGCGSLLPVTLEFFGAAPTSEGVLLQWAAANPHEVQNIAVEHSLDGTTFETLADHVSDTYLDALAKRGTHYYRLQMTDMEGIQTLSGVVTVVADDELDQKLILAHMDEYISVRMLATDNLPLELTISDMSGKVIHAAQSQGTTGWNVWDVTTQGWAPGVYLAKVSGGHKPLHGKFLVVN